jgi:glycosyltransferase involved in cell wall biosynthesis
MSAPALAPVVTSCVRPLVTVVMPTFNRASLMRESASMVLNQTLRDLELLICDDGSTDETADVVAQIAAEDKRVRYLRMPTRGGITGVVNYGIRASCGQYVQICHDHDIYLPPMLERLACIFECNPSVVFAHPGRQGCDYHGVPNRKAYFVCGYAEVTPGDQWRSRMLRGLASPVTGLSMIRRSALERIGLFDPEFGACSDIDMWLRLCAVGDAGYANELLLYVRGRHPNHPYAGVNWTISDEIIRIHRKHLRLTYSGVHYWWWKIRREVGIDVSLLFDFLNSMRHRRWDQVRAGRIYLRRSGPLVSRLAAWVL